MALADRCFSALMVAATLFVSMTPPLAVAEDTFEEREGQPVPAERLWPPVFPGVGENGTAKILSQLDATTKLQFDGAQLREVLDYLHALHGVPFELDKRVLEEININNETLITTDVQGITLRSGLRSMLRGIDPELTYTVQDEMLRITTRKAAAGVQVDRSYDVSALLTKDETAKGLATLLEKNFLPLPNTANPQPADAPPAIPFISAHGASILVRGTEAQHEAIVRTLRCLKEAADAAQERAAGAQKN